jgi:excisionase family DNA binding protein
MDEELTVDEAALHLRVSVATIKRLCKNGEIEARKVGRSWLIRKGSLDSQSSKSRPLIKRTISFDLEQAATHIASHDLVEDAWVPDVLCYADELADRQLGIDEAARRLGAKDFGTPVQVKVPKTSFFPRNATDLSLSDRIAYQAVIQHIADEIDLQTPPTVFSARRSPNKGEFLRDGRNSWLEWNAAFKKELATGDEFWVVATDITSYFDYIKHELLIPDVQRLSSGTEAGIILREMLKTWTSTPNSGIPQGPNASRVLGNFYLVPVDLAMGMHAPDVTYSRYMDDIRIVAKTRSEAIRALQLLDDECRKRGLNLSNKKTQLFNKEEAIQSLEDTELDDAAYLFGSTESSEQSKRVILRKLFASAVEADGNIKIVKGRRAKFALWRLYRMRDVGALRQTLRNLETLAPLGKLVSMYLHPFASRKLTQKQVSKFLMDSDRNTSEYLSCWLLAMFLDYGRTNVIPEVVQYAGSVARNGNAAGYHRHVAVALVGSVGTVLDIAFLEEIVRRDVDPGMVRSALVGLHRAARLEKSTSATAVRRFPQLEVTVKYLSGRNSLQSLIFRGKEVKVP